MIPGLNLKRPHSINKRKFQEFVFVGNISDKSVADATRQLILSPNSGAISQAKVEDFFLIKEVHTDKNTARQLKELKIKPGVTIELVSKTSNGSVVVSVGDKLIGIGAEIARKIVATPAC